MFYIYRISVYIINPRLCCVLWLRKNTVRRNIYRFKCNSGFRSTRRVTDTPFPVPPISSQLKTAFQTLKLWADLFFLPSYRWADPRDMMYLRSPKGGSSRGLVVVTQVRCLHFFYSSWSMWELCSAVPRSFTSTCTRYTDCSECWNTVGACVPHR